MNVVLLSQVSTGDSWASDVARPMMFGVENTMDQPDTEEGNRTGEIVLIALFFCSFVFIVTFTLLQVVVAVLLDNFVNATDLEKQREASKDMPRVQKSSLDPLLTALLQYNTDVELSGRVGELFDVLDENQNGRLSFKECSGKHTLCYEFSNTARPTHHGSKTFPLSPCFSPPPTSPSSP